MAKHPRYKKKPPGKRPPSRKQVLAERKEQVKKQMASREQRIERKKIEDKLESSIRWWRSESKEEKRLRIVLEEQEGKEEFGGYVPSWSRVTEENVQETAKRRKDVAQEVIKVAKELAEIKGVDYKTLLPFKIKN